MDESTDLLIHRLHILGLNCDAVPLDRHCSATTALTCFPMYMVANVHAFTDDKQWTVPVVDLPGFESLRESYAIGRQEKQLEIDSEHNAVLRTLLSNAKPSDRAIYEYALNTIELFFSLAEPAVVEEARTAIARMIVAVAEASGKGLFGSGEKISEEEWLEIDNIDSHLQLRESEEAAGILQRTD